MKSSKMKTTRLLILLNVTILFFTNQLSAQDYLMNNTADTSCTGSFYDSGGAGGNYGNYQNQTKTFVSGNGNRLQFNFQSFNLYNSSDYLRIYDGPTSNYPLIGSFSNNQSPGLVESSGETITFVFYSSSSGNSSGWHALISCTTAPLIAYNMSNDTLTLCNAVLYDPAGPGSNYLANQIFTQTVYASTGLYIEAGFNKNAFGLAAGDTLKVFDGNSTAAAPLATFVIGSIPETVTSSGNSLTFLFTSDISSLSQGWQVFISCTSVSPAAETYLMSSGVRYVCSGVFSDPGGTGSNYPNSSSKTQTFASYTANRLQVNFTQFQMYNSSDYLRIYDGPSSAYPLLGSYSTGQNPGNITSSGDALTFYFYSSSSGTSSGWIANLNCDGPQLPVYNMLSGVDSICSAVFYDHGGNHGNYPDYEDRTHTFCSQTGEMLQFTFNQQTWGLQNSDSLFVYDGSDVNAPALAVFVNGSQLETLTSSGDCMTFYFKSNETGNSRGWQAWIECTSVTPPQNNYIISSGIRYVCDGSFTDTGGINSNYGNSESKTETFISYNGNRIQFDFTQFQMYNSSDYMRIYDGSSIAHPLLGTFSYGQNPGSVISSGDALTFYFYSSSSGTSSGWTASISCAGPQLPVYNMLSGVDSLCSAVFYDNGGNHGNYPDYEDRTHTFCSQTGEMLQFTFNQSTWGLQNSDSLFVYDGFDVNASVLAVFVNGSQLETLTSSGDCMTFYFKSNETSNSRGWQAWIECTSVTPPQNNYIISSGIRYVCDGSFTDTGGTNGNYGYSESKTETFISYSGNRIQFSFTQFQMYNSSDYMRIYDGSSTAYPLLGTFSYGQNPGTIISSGDALTFYFYSSSSGNSTGWHANISCDGPQLPVYNMSAGVDSVCSSVFYDNGGSNNNYPDYEDRTHTFCSQSGDMLQFTFNQASFGMQVSDSLFVFDGATINAPKLAVFVSGSQLETLSSSGDCLTFYFKSNEISNLNGWQAWIECISLTPPQNNFIISSGLRYLCDGSFTDTGGLSGNYGNSENKIQTFVSYNGNRIEFNFTQFQLYNSNDYLKIYDGPSTAYPLMGTYSNSQNPGTVVSSADALTFHFYSSSSGSSTGWHANISCAGPQLPVFNMSSGIDSVCSSVFYDHGGSHAHYPDYEDRIHTFCSQTGDMLQFTFNQNACAINTSDTLFVFDGPDTNSPPLAAFVYYSQFETISSSSDCMTFYFKSNESGNWHGWQSWIDCITVPPASTNYVISSGIRYVCDGSFTDTGGLNGSYSNNENKTQTFTSFTGNRLKFEFTQFLTYNSNDYLRIYDGPSTAYPLIGSYSYNQSPGIIISSGTSLTFNFYSSSSGSTNGWHANISCDGPPLPVYLMGNNGNVSCEGVFYDHNGPAMNYAANENYFETFCSPSGSYLTFSFNPNAWSLAAGDTLFVYDGQNVAAPIRGKYTGLSYVEDITSFGTCLTFRFSSDNISQYSGWQSIINCDTVQPSDPNFLMSGGVRYVCAGTFTDDGGPNSNYSDYLTQTETFASYTGDHIRFDFLNFQTYNSADKLYIYDGWNESAPLIGSYYGSQNPGIIISSGEAITFKFYSSNYSNSSGWLANISCQAAPNAPLAWHNFPLCYGDSLELYASSSPGATYSWTGPNGFVSSDQNPVIQNVNTNTSGIYQVFATDQGLNSDTTWLEVLAYPIPANPLIYSNSPVCSGDLLTISTDTLPNGNYFWTGPSSFASNVQNPAIFSVNQSYQGSYSLVVEAFGCYSDTSEVLILVNTVTPPVVSNNGPLCEGEELSMVASSISGASYEWTGPQAFQSSSQNPVLSNMSTAQSGSYSLIVLQGACYSSPVITEVIVNPLPSAPAIYGNNIFCADSTLTLTSDPLSNGNYYWYGPDSFSSSLQNIEILSLDSSMQGQYNLYIEVSGCFSDTTSMIIDVQYVDIPVISWDSTICEGDTVILECLSVADTYEWFGPLGYYTTVQNPVLDSIHVYSTGIYTLISYINGCPSLAVSDSLVVHEIPDIPSATSNSPVCDGSILILNISPQAGSFFEWTHPNGDVSVGTELDLIANSSVEGIFLLTETIHGCRSDYDTLYVIVKPIPEITSIGSNSPLCEGGNLELSSTALIGADYQWYGPLNFTCGQSDTIVIDAIIDMTGNYQLVTSLDGCSATDSIEVIVNAPPNDPLITQTDSILSTGSAHSYQWFDINGIIPGATDQSFIPQISGEYSVWITNEFDCSAQSAMFNYVHYGIEESFAHGLKIYPNPADDVFVVELDHASDSDLRFILCDCLGQVLLVTFMNKGEAMHTINVTSIPAGIYYLNIVGKTYQYRHRVIKL
jgi:hypothetical protein